MTRIRTFFSWLFTAIVSFFGYEMVTVNSESFGLITSPSFGGEGISPMGEALDRPPVKNRHQVSRRMALRSHRHSDRKSQRHTLRMMTRARRARGQNIRTGR